MGREPVGRRDQKRNQLPSGLAGLLLSCRTASESRDKFGSGRSPPQLVTNWKSSEPCRGEHFPGYLLSPR